MSFNSIYVQVRRRKDGETRPQPRVAASRRPRLKHKCLSTMISCDHEGNQTQGTYGFLGARNRTVITCEDQASVHNKQRRCRHAAVGIDPIDSHNARGGIKHELCTAISNVTKKAKKQVRTTVVWSHWFAYPRAEREPAGAMMIAVSRESTTARRVTLTAYYVQKERDTTA
jgi:hypothetical protein